MLARTSERATRAGRANRVTTIDCTECIMRDTPVCDDCVVTFVVGRDPGEALVIDAAEARAVRMLSGAGLVPALRHTAARSAAR
jgi:hypothetical protein